MSLNDTSGRASSDPLRHPTDAEKEAELRLYFLARTDRLPGIGDLCRLAGRATMEALAIASRRDCDSYLKYFRSPAQPKICLRAKNAAIFERTLSTLPHAAVVEISGEPVFTAFGPIARKDLPDQVRKLQILGSDAPAIPTLQLPPAKPAPFFTLLLRNDVEIPYGKLAAQAGHGIWGAARHLFKPDGAVDQAQKQFMHWIEASCPIVVRRAPDLRALENFHALAGRAGLNASFIIDAGRTVFTAPTPTLACIGPVDRLPEEIDDLPEVR